MKVKMLKTTSYQGLRKIGEVEEVPVEVANRWLAKGIAVTMVDEIVANAPVEAEIPSFEGYEDKSPKELFALCKARGIELNKEMINGKTPDEKKAYLISMLSGFDEANVEK